MAVTPDTGPSRTVVVRDLLVFQLKLLLDGLKDVFVSQIAIGAAIIDLLAGGRRHGRLFYSVMARAEAFDQWLNLYGAARRAGHDPEGLMGGSGESANSLISDLEAFARDRVRRSSRASGGDSETDASAD